MSVVKLNEGALTAFLDTRTGPVGRDMLRRAEHVALLARQNASGPIIGIQTGDLYEGINVDVIDTPRMEARISTPAEHRNFAYPAYWDQHGRPWLTTALRDGFR